jgi:uncharacterized repeat protein (TIGR03837 family)
MTAALRWDIFCRVIDNHGDLGVSWRLARQLAGRGHHVRLWVDDDRALTWMAPQGCAGVQVLPWTEPLTCPDDLPPGQVLVEMFGCEIPPQFVQRYVDWRGADGSPTAWFNLEYLSAEPYVERCHGLPSPVMHGPGRGLQKIFFYPGFTPRTGGLLREPDLLARQARFDAPAWLAAQRCPAGPGPRVSLFCYEPPALAQLLQALAQQRATLLVTAGRAAAAVRACAMPQGLTLHELPWLSQDDYDHLLWACDLNFVRGEDSLVRALWADRPLVWHIYPQHDQAHHAKLQAFLDWLQAPASLRAFHAAWNGLHATDLPPPDPTRWQPAVTAARARLLAQIDLLTQLLQTVERLRAVPGNF